MDKLDAHGYVQCAGRREKNVAIEVDLIVQLTGPRRRAVLVSLG